MAKITLNRTTAVQIIPRTTNSSDLIVENTASTNAGVVLIKYGDTDVTKQEYDFSLATGEKITSTPVGDRVCRRMTGIVEAGSGDLVINVGGLSNE
jgi:hypothetical protein